MSMVAGETGRASTQSTFYCRTARKPQELVEKYFSLASQRAKATAEPAVFGAF